MTEHEWLASQDPAAMLAVISDQRFGSQPDYVASDRKLRLFCCACCREKGSSTQFESLLEHYEKEGFHYPDDSSPPMSDLNWARAWTEKGEGKPKDLRKAEIMRCVFGNVFRPLRCSVTGNPLGTDTVQLCADGSLKGCDCRWLTPTVLSVAQSIHDEGRWGEVGVLADALEDAGCVGTQCVACEGKGGHWRCPNCHGEWRGDVGPDCFVCGHPKLDRHDCLTCRTFGSLPHPLVAHLRDGKKHHRGCWAVDALLGLS